MKKIIQAKLKSSMDDIVISTHKIFLLLNPPYSSSRNCGTSQWKIVAIGSIPTNQKQYYY